jgi:hypothetical protein
MSTARRGFLSRIGIRRTHDLPPVVERFNVRISIDNDDDDDAASIHTILPAYSPRSNRPLPQQFLYRPPSPTPTYYSVDERETPPLETITHHHHPDNDYPINQIDPQSVVDGLINRLRESLKNPKSWRVLRNGEKSFFWALRCAPGTADILNDNLGAIRSKIIEAHDWRVEKFCVIFRGQKLGDLWCRPIHTEVGFIYNSFS